MLLTGEGEGAVVLFMVGGVVAEPTAFADEVGTGGVSTTVD